VQSLFKPCWTKWVSIPELIFTSKKGLPLGSGMGSSAASAVAALVAANEI